MLYISTWDILKLIHKMLLNAEVSLEDQEGSEILLGTVGKKPAPALTASDLMHSLLEIRSHINDIAKLREIYARYPELLKYLTLEAILLGQDIFLPGTVMLKYRGLILFCSTYCFSSCVQINRH